MRGVILMSVSVLLAFKAGCGMKQTGMCRPVCTGGDCVTVDQDRVDFKTAQKACRDRSGDLLTLHPETDASLLDNLREQLSGNFWIGLRLPAGTCSNLSSPLRGYEWTSGSTNGSFIPSSVTWKHSVKVCSGSCVSLSNDQKWTERLCTDRADGYLCRTKHKDACPAQQISDPQVFRSPKGCSTFPCEHDCKDVTGGYKCSCYPGYMPDSKDPRQCKLHCGKQRCPQTCDRRNKEMCFCPDGFISDEKFCEDVDECEMETCDQGCKNTFGSYQCFCTDGFVLRDEYKCIKADSERFPITTPITVGFVKPALKNNHTLKNSSAPAGGFLWLWICAVVAVVLLICAVRMYVVRRQKRREQNSCQQSSVPATALVNNERC